MKFSCVNFAFMIAFGVFVLSGCSVREVSEPHSVTIVAAQAPPPAGVVRYCYEEPIVAYEANGPGLDGEGRWYHPSYVAVRQVRSGKWRPCTPVADEIKGETRNER